MRATLASLTLLLLAALAMPAGATITIPGSNNGSDGALNVTNGDLTIDLGKAVAGSWDQAGTGVGVYDSTKWVVVFKYSSVNIAAGRTVRFTNHPANAPVVWLVQGVATIAGALNLDGENGNANNRETVPGPGGFPGGRGTFVGSRPTAGHGPGGGPVTTDYRIGGAYATQAPGGGGVVYGNSRILPLIGGSGAGGSGTGYVSGGAGGGAILIVVGQRCALTGSLSAVGGSENESYGYSGEASGGAIRIVADTLSGNGSITAISRNNYGGQGRIRLETNVFSYASQSSPSYSLQLPLGPDGVVIWPPAPEPRLVITTVNGQPVTADPHMDAQALVSGDLVINKTSLVPVIITATNLPTNATVTVRVVLGADPAYTTNATFQSGDGTSSTWLATIPALSPQRVSAIQAKAVLP